LIAGKALSLPTGAPLPKLQQMIRFLITTALLAIATMDCWGQLSVYICSETGQIGWATGYDNTNGVRDNKAYQHCKDYGGKYPVWKMSHNGPGCYAIVEGRDEKGEKKYGMGAGAKSTEEAHNIARQQAMSIGALQNGLSSITSGCSYPPPSKVEEKRMPVWSEWTSEVCAYLEYRTKVLEGYDWNYQVHVYIQVRSKFRIPVTYLFELADGNGKVHFGDQHRNNPGETIEFIHKMSEKIIKKIRIKDLRNTQSNKPINCDDADGGKKILRPGEFDDLQEAIAEYNKLLPRVPESVTKTSNYDYTVKILSSKESNDFKLSTVNNSISYLRSIVEHLPNNTAAPQSKPDLSGDIIELSRKEISLINDIRTIEPNANVKAWDGSPTDNQAFTLQKKKENISYLENYLNKASSKTAEEKAAKEREKNAFNSYMQKGNDAMNNKDYTRAMSNYQAAMNGTSDADDKALASGRYNQALEAQKNAERQVRVAAAKDRDKEEDIAYTTAAASAAGFMAMLKDGYSSKPFAAKFLLGLGYEHAPILSNGTGKSYIEERNLFTLHTGFNIGVFNNSAVSFYLKPQVNLGLSAFASGISGGFVSYGASGVLQLALKKHSKFNVFAEGGWFNHEGTFKYDADARNNTTTDDVRQGKMKYTKLVYGGGFMLRWIDKWTGKETFLRPAAFYEIPSFFTSAVKPVLSMNLQVYIYSGILFDLTYTPNTYIPGELHHPTALEKKNVSSYGVRIIRQGRLF